MADAVQRRPRVLLVDDELNVLEGLALVLGRRFECRLAKHPAEALALFASEPEFAAVVSDMRMPGMTGAELLSKLRELYPATTRILLTGQADLGSAISAVNDGQVFRFLCKPSPPDQLRAVVDAAVQQHRLVTAERELLEQTLRGVVQALVDVLGIVHPEAFGHAGRLRWFVDELARRMKMEDRWALEVAAQLSLLWVIALPPETTQRALSGKPLNEVERRSVDRGRSVVDALLARIPRLGRVRDLVRHVGSSQAATSEDEAVLRVALELASYELRGVDLDEAIQLVRSRRPKIDERLSAALGGLCERAFAEEVFELAPDELVPDLVLAMDLVSDTGALLARKGYETSEGFVERLRNMTRSRLPAKIAVIDPRGRSRRTTDATRATPG